MESLRGGVLTDENTALLVAAYHDAVREHIEVSPDVYLLPANGAVGFFALLEAWEQELRRITGLVSRYRAEYDQVIERPMPIALHRVELGNPFNFEWGASHDLQGDGLTYDFQVSTTAAFDVADIILERAGLAETSTSIDPLPSGTYHWRVIIRDTKDPALHWQLPFSEFETLQVP
jgi:spore coat protein H